MKLICAVLLVIIHGSRCDPRQRLLPCPYYAHHPQQYLCNYTPFTWTPIPEASGRDARRTPHPHNPFVFHPIHGECEIFDDHEAFCRHCSSCRLIGSSVHCNCFGRFADAAARPSCFPFCDNEKPASSEAAPPAAAAAEPNAAAPSGGGSVNINGDVGTVGTLNNIANNYNANKITFINHG